VLALLCLAARHWWGRNAACSPQRFTVWLLVMSLAWVPVRIASGGLILSVWSGVAFVGSAWVIGRIAAALIQKQ
jgi:hypothetical protein